MPAQHQTAQSLLLLQLCMRATTLLPPKHYHSSSSSAQTNMHTALQRSMHTCWHPLEWPQALSVLSLPP